MCLPCPRLIRVLRTTLHHRYVHVLRQWRSKRRFEFFFVHPATGAQEFDHPFRVLPKYAASFQRTGLIGRWKTRTKGISILSLFHSSFPSPRVSDFLRMAVIPSYLTCRRNGKRAIEEEMWRGGKRAHFESVKDGSCHDGGPRDGRTLMSRPAVPRRFASHLVGSSDVICDVECRRRYEIQIRSHGLHTSN